MYVGRRHTATLEATMLQPFTCVHCAFESLARVRTKGEGEGTSPFMLREQGAKDAASAEAETQARENAAELAKMGTCPACERRDESVISGTKTSAWIKAIAFALLAGGLVWFVTSSGRHGMGDFGFILSAAVAVGTLFLTVSKDSWKWSELEARVSVLNVQEALAELERFKREAS